MESQSGPTTNAREVVESFGFDATTRAKQFAQSVLEETKVTNKELLSIVEIHLIRGYLEGVKDTFRYANSIFASANK